MAIGLRLEEVELHFRMETHTLQQQIDDGREAQPTGAGMEAATEEDQGPQRGRIRLEDTHAPDHPFPERVGTLDLLRLERDRHSLSRENHRRTADRGRPLSEKGYPHQQGRDTRGGIFLLPGIYALGSRTNTITVMLNALLLQYDALSMPLGLPPLSLLVALRLMCTQKG